MSMADKNSKIFNKANQSKTSVTTSKKIDNKKNKRAPFINHTLINNSKVISKVKEPHNFSNQGHNLNSIKRYKRNN